MTFQAVFAPVFVTRTVVSRINPVPDHTQVFSISPKSKVITLSGEIVIVESVVELTPLDTIAPLRNSIPAGKVCVTVAHV